MRPPGNGHDTATPPAITYRDSATGLHLQSATGEVSVRIARSSRGPLDPPPRQGTPDASWSRYDVTGWTVYTAETRETAYAEVLAYTKRRLGQRDPLAEDAAAIGLSLAEFTDLVGQEWSERQHMGMGHLPASWRIERLLCRITLPTQGWWINVEYEAGMTVPTEEDWLRLTARVEAAGTAQRSTAAIVRAVLAVIVLGGFVMSLVSHAGSRGHTLGQVVMAAAAVALAYLLYRHLRQAA